MSKNRIITALVAVLLLASNMYAANPKREWRATWLATAWSLDWPTSKGAGNPTIQKVQKNEMIKYLDLMVEMKMTTVCFQVRSMCDAMYKSSYEPWSSYLTDSRGADPGWDPLEFVVAECHARGLECYAWVNPLRYNSSSSVTWGTSQDKALEASGWLIKQGANIHLNPGIPEARARVVNVCKEIITNYKVDGIIFDDYFYPQGLPNGSTAPDYTLYKNSGFTAGITSWRRENINTMVREVYNMIQNTRPDVRFGIGPAGVAGRTLTHGLTACPVGSDWQFNGIFSDPLAWLEEGTIDYIAPQIYWHTDDSSSPYEPITKWWSYAANAFGRHHYASVDISDLTTSSTSAHLAEHDTQIQLNRKYTENNAPGVCFYSTKYLLSGKSKLAAQLEANTLSTPAIVPQITWDTYGNSTSYGAVKNGSYSGGTLNWSATSSSNRIIRYSVYAVPSSVSSDAAKASNGDGLDAKYLLGTSYNTSYSIPSGKQSGYWYAVCVLDGWGKEHTPALINYSNSGGSSGGNDNTGGNVGGTESGYTIVKDNSTYSKVGSMTLSSVWYRSVDKGNLSFESNGALNRGFVALGNYVYVAGRDAASASAGCYLRKYNGATGEYLGKITLTGAGTVSSYPCNDVFKDDNGNVCINNLTTNVSTTPLKIHKVNLSTGALTEVASVTSSKLSSGRVDHAALLGNVATGTFTVYAAIANGTQVVRWNFSNGSLSSEEVCNLASFYPTTATSLGTAPKVKPVTSYSFFVDGANTSWSRYAFGTGSLMDSWAEKTDLAPSTNGGNGGTYFALNNKYYMVYPAADNNSGWKYNVTYSASSSMGFDSMNKMWILPTAGLGTINNSVAQACVDYVQVNANTVRIYVYVPGNGIAAYDLKDTSISGIEDVFGTQDNITIKNVGGTIVLSEEAETVMVYNMMGIQVAYAENTAEVSAPLNVGLYIVMANVNGKLYKQKLMVK